MRVRSPLIGSASSTVALSASPSGCAIAANSSLAERATSLCSLARSGFARQHTVRLRQPNQLDVAHSVSSVSSGDGVSDTLLRTQDQLAATHSRPNRCRPLAVGAWLAARRAVGGPASFSHGGFV